METFFAQLALVLMLAVGGGGSSLPTPQLVITTREGARVPVSVELAITPAERSRGLMEREDIPDGHGMLFVWSAPTTGGFWMKNTPHPLSIAWFDEDGVIIDIQDMQPFDEAIHSPGRPYRYALEVNQGFFARAGVAVGDRVSLDVPLATPTPAPPGSPTPTP